MATLSSLETLNSVDINLQDTLDNLNARITQLEALIENLLGTVEPTEAD